MKIAIDETGRQQESKGKLKREEYRDQIVRAL
jgi:hypothetical protein